MTRTATSKGAGSTRLLGFALTTALASATLTGCAASAPQAAHSASKAEELLAKGNSSKAVEHAEAAVMADPRNASYRAMLGAAYLESGRFASAATSFQDAIDLGDTAPRTALSLALSLTAQGKYAAAQDLLKEWEGTIGAGDLGLAYTLAGAPERGIHILGNAIRNGENTAKVRQNLAYSYALDGRWKEARLMASEDIAGDKVGDRMEQWAIEAHPELYRTRVASLLSVPATVADGGQPVQLALSNFPTADQLAAGAVLSQPAAQQIAEAQPVTVPASQATGRVAMVADLPEGDSAIQASVRASVPASSIAASHAVERVAPREVVLPRSASANASYAPAASSASRSSAPAPRGVDAVSSAPGSHLVQLGSFSSEKGARRAWEIYVQRYPELANRDMVMTRAIVRGKEYFRVAAAGYDAGSSRAMCGRVNRASSEGCIAHAASSPLPGAIDTGRRLAMR